MSKNNFQKLMLPTSVALTMYVLLLILSLERSPVSFFGVLVVGLAVLISENMHIDIPGRAGVSVSFLFLSAGMLIFGTTTAGLAGLFAAVTLYDLKTKTPILLWIFNGFQMGISALMCGMTIDALLRLSNQSLLPSSLNEMIFSANLVLLLPVLLIGFFVFSVCNLCLVSWISAVRTGTSTFELFLARKSIFLQGYLGAMPFSIAIAVVFEKVGIIGFVMLIAPLMIIRQMFLTYLNANQNVAEIVKTLVSTIEAKDTYTRQHSERVAKYSKLIGSQLKLPESQLVSLEKAAYLHDIGKIAVKRNILNKPQRLTDQEMSLMKKHPVIGYKLVKNIKLLEDALDPILKHHEFIGGGGYPLGTKEIPKMARIIAIADAYDAMTSLRPYRQPMSHEQAIAELHRGSGRQFDAELVELFESGMAGSTETKNVRLADKQAQLEFAN